MRLKFLLWLILGVATISAADDAMESLGVKIVTGARNWKMADGTIQRMRFSHFIKNEHHDCLIFDGNIAKSLKDFAPEEHEVFAALRSGQLKQVTTPGLFMDPDFPTGKLPDWLKEDPPWVGETRIWENTNGKRVEARLICLTDDDVSLLIGEMIGRVPLNELGAADLVYLEELKSGLKRTYCDKVVVFSHHEIENVSSWGRISGEKFAELAKQGSQFELALNAALRHISSKLDRRKWELTSFDERVCSAPEITYQRPKIPNKEDCPFVYAAHFLIKPTAKDECQKYWPLLSSPKSSSGKGDLTLYLMADGTILIPEREIHYR